MHDYTYTTDSYFALKYKQKSLCLLLATSVRITSAPETPQRAMQPQTTLPSPRRSIKKDPESRLFHFNYFACLRHPLGACLNPNPGQPSGLTATINGQGRRRVSHLRSGCTKSGQNSRMSTHCPPIHGLPCPPAAPPGVWMMCPRAARIGAHRSLRPVSGVLMDPLQPSERLPRLSRAAPAEIPAPQQPPWSAVTVRRHK